MIILQAIQNKIGITKYKFYTAKGEYSSTPYTMYRNVDGGANKNYYTYRFRKVMVYNVSTI